MSEQTNPLDQNQEEQSGPTELEMLKQQAALMGVTHSNNIGVDALRKKIAAKMEGEQDNTDADGVEITQPNPLAPAPTAPVASAEATPAVPAGKPKTLQQHLREKSMRLVRIRISSMDPKKQDLDGEFITVANEFIGTVRKYVPFGEKTDKGYHVPQCIYDHLKGREFLHVQTRERNGQLETKTRYVKEFAIEVLPDLTPAELRALAADQRATGRLDDEE